jgi:hypothetical protein
MDMPLNCESSPLSNLLPWIRACHYEEYEVIKIVLLVLASVFLACAVVNFILLGYTVGWKNWNQNVRIKTQFIVCGLIVLGMHCGGALRFRVSPPSFHALLNCSTRKANAGFQSVVVLGDTICRRHDMYTEAAICAAIALTNVP